MCLCIHYNLGMSLVLHEFNFEVRIRLKLVEIYLSYSTVTIIKSWLPLSWTTHIDCVNFIHCGGINSSIWTIIDRFEKIFQGSYLVPPKWMFLFWRFIEMSVLRFHELSFSKSTLCLLEYGDFNRPKLDLLLWKIFLQLAYGVCCCDQYENRPRFKP